MAQPPVTSSLPKTAVGQIDGGGSFSTIATRIRGCVVRPVSDGVNGQRPIVIAIDYHRGDSG
jgi:hypothetical protein